MNDKLFLNNEVSKITGLSPRQVISWTEKGLIQPERPAKQAGTMRGYNYINLLELGLVKYLMGIIGVQFFTAKTILDDFKKSGEIERWASSKQYSISVSSKVYDKTTKKQVEKIDTELFTFDINTSDSVNILYYIIMDFPAVSYYRTVRVISPLSLNETIKAFNKEFYNIDELLKSKGMIVVNIGEIKREIDKGIERLG